MKLSECLNYINQALNYPALSFNDVSLYFDSAIAELNTTLHTDIPVVSKMIEEYKQQMLKTPTVILDYRNDPKVNPEIVVSYVDTIGIYYNPETKLFYYPPNQSSKALDAIYLRQGVKERYKAIVYGATAAWQLTDYDEIQECELEYYLPEDWILLWLIPYICYKYTVRDGGTAGTFAEELTQGYQQLQESYNVPATVVLATYADRPAYHDAVEQNLPNLNIRVRTRAIYEDMKHSRALNAIYGSMYDRGGF